MFENKTFENIMESMLDNVPDTIDKREGSIIYDAIAPIALELAQAYSDIGLILDESTADTASYYYLIKRAAERGIMVKEGTSSIVVAKPTPYIPMEIGTTFTNGDLSFSIVEDYNDGTFGLECNETGEQGNVHGYLTPVDTITGVQGRTLQTMEIEYIKRYGTDDESEDDLRARYFASFEGDAFGGNVTDYKNKAKEFDIAKMCAVIPCWNGPGTVKLVIGNYTETNGVSAFNNVICTDMQQAFDPDETGMGLGLAPIGHSVTVTSATVNSLPLYVNVYVADKSMISRDTENQMAEELTAAIWDYIFELQKSNFENGSSITVSNAVLKSKVILSNDLILDADVSINQEFSASNSGRDYTIPEYSLINLEYPTVTLLKN